MHREKNEAELLSLDHEIEITLTRLRKLKITEQEGMVEQEDMGDNTRGNSKHDQCKAEDYGRPMEASGYRRLLCYGGTYCGC